MLNISCNRTPKNRLQKILYIKIEVPKKVFYSIVIRTTVFGSPKHLSVNSEKKSLNVRTFNNLKNCFYYEGPCCAMERFHGC